MRRIQCPWHHERTASLVQYQAGWKCFGACQKFYTNEEVVSRTGEQYEYQGPVKEDKEDITEKLRYIRSLPTSDIRGLRLPADARGYYLVWHDADYYKYRLFEPGKGSKYLNPRGHKPPLFWAKRAGSQTLSIVEGEFNALSVSLAYPEWDVCSPGSASCFNADNLGKHLTQFKNYSNILVVLDDDPAGIKGLIEAKAFLLYKLPFTSYKLVKPDPNEILVNEGPQTLRTELQRGYPQQATRNLL